MTSATHFANVKKLRAFSVPERLLGN
jgi:hypothetical protein